MNKIRIRKANQSRNIVQTIAPDPNIQNNEQKVFSQKINQKTSQPLNYSTLGIKLCLFIIGITILFMFTATRSAYFRDIHGGSTISWTDFIKLHNITYQGLENTILSDSKLINKRIATVGFMVSTAVTNHDFKTRNGDAAFWKKGTPIYSIKGLSDKEFIAVADKKSINGYRIYYNERLDYEWHYRDIPKDKITEIGLYRYYRDESESFWVNDLIRTINEKENINKFISLLDSGTIEKGHKNNDTPSYYKIALHTGEIISYEHLIIDDLVNFYWFPWEKEILHEEIKPWFADDLVN